MRFSHGAQFRVTHGDRQLKDVRRENQLGGWLAEVQRALKYPLVSRDVRRTRKAKMRFPGQVVAAGKPATECHGGGGPELLKDRRRQAGGTLSGGEQQMLGMARALMARPKLLVMDEPSMGLSPKYVEKSFETIAAVHAQGVSILIVEQNANMALSIADRGYVLQVGEIVLTGTARELRDNPALKRAYLNTAAT